MPNYIVESVGGRLSVRCTLTEDDARRDFTKLCALQRAEMATNGTSWHVERSTGASAPADQKLLRLNKPFKGQYLAEFCHWESRFHTPTDKNKSAFELLAKETTTVEWLERCYTKSQGKERAAILSTDDDPSRTETQGSRLYEALRRRSSLESVTHFRASAAKFFCDEWKAQKVLDACAGWGDRFSGFMASATVKEVVLIDPRKLAHPKYQQQYSIASSVREERGWSRVDLRTFDEPAEGDVFHMIPGPLLRELIEDVHKGPLRRMAETEAGTFDLCMTSPPYFCKELYGCGENDWDGQCWEIYDLGREAKRELREDGVECWQLEWSEFERWYDDFLEPMLHTQVELLRPGGHLVLNIDNVDDFPICDYTLRTMSRVNDMQFVGTAGLQKGGHGGRCEPVYIWRKTVNESNPTGTTRSEHDTVDPHLDVASCTIADPVTDHVTTVAQPTDNRRHDHRPPLLERERSGHDSANHGDHGTPAYPDEEYKWVVQSLFRKTTETGSHIKAKGENGFFLTIKNSNDPRVQRAWQMSCSGDSSKINEALSLSGGKKHSQLPPTFMKTWDDATKAVFGVGFKGRTQLTTGNIHCYHLYQIGLKSGATYLY